MESTAEQILTSIFGYKQFRNQQEKIIAALVAKQDVLAIMPTGGGKSLCYQIPALLAKGPSIVISPLISLMKDQVDQLQANGIAAAFLNSLQSQDEHKHILYQYQTKKIKLLYIAPERLRVEAFRRFLLQYPPQLFAIDEAHCISQWGHDFRPEYRALHQLKSHFPQLPIIALTATADTLTRHDIVHMLALEQPYVAINSFDRPNIQYRVVEKFNAIEQITVFLKHHQGDSGIIYCSSRTRVEQLTLHLQQQGIGVRAYHAGFSAQQRQQAQEEFLRDNVQIIVATVAFGMGINKPNVRFVIHADIPRTIEAYYQETGRAGRDGLAAEALLLFDPKDIIGYRWQLNDQAESQQKQVSLNKLNAVASFAEGLTCRRMVLLNYFNESLAKSCGNCDICLFPPTSYDGLEDAQKILSCVCRVGQRFGINHIVALLRGANTARMRELGHDTLSVYGIGKKRPSAYWISVIRQLIHRGLLRLEMSSHPTLVVPENARAILRGEKALTLAVPRIALTKHEKAVNKQRPALATLSLTAEETKLYGELRHLRKRLADKEAVPPYVIFSDATLLEMVFYLPMTQAELLNINGIGQIKLQKYGPFFLEKIVTFVNE